MMLKFPAIVLQLCALLFFAIAACGTSHADDVAPAMPFIDVKTGRAVAKSYAGLGGHYKIVYAVDWGFHGNSGRIVSVQLRTKGYMSCELYQVERGGLKLIQAHPFCSWTRKPHLVTNKGVTSIEFPIKIKQGAGYPINESSIQIDFDVGSNGICTYNVSYEDDAASVPKCPGS